MRRRRYISLAFWARERREASRMIDPDGAREPDESGGEAEADTRDPWLDDVLSSIEIHLDAA